MLASRMEIMKSILVVDDEPDYVELIKYRLKAGGFNVISARNGREGILKAETENPDLILLDIKMPGMNGFEVCHHLKHNDCTKHIPVIIVTSKDKDSDVSRGLQEGAVCFLTKPWNPVDLISEINTALQMALGNSSTHPYPSDPGASKQMPQ